MAAAGGCRVFLAPLALIVKVSFWQATDHELIPAFTPQAYIDIFNVCFDGGSCVSGPTCLSTLKFSLLVGLFAAFTGYTGVWLLAFHYKSRLWQTVPFILCTVPLWTSPVIRMVSGIPLLGRNGLINNTLRAAGGVRQPVEWLLFSDFSVLRAFVHLTTLFMIVPIFNSMMCIDKSRIEAARDWMQKRQRR